MISGDPDPVRLKVSRRDDGPVGPKFRRAVQCYKTFWNRVYIYLIRYHFI